MRITKFGHACVRIEYDGSVVVLDPGVFTDPEAVDGADAVLITHEHPDHYDDTRLRATDAAVFTIGAVAARIGEDAPDLAERVTVVSPGERFDVGALAVRTVGERHAVIHPELPRFDNSGFLLTAGGERVFHPGDALTLPEEEVDVLCVPSSAPWLKASEAVDFARAVRAPRNLAIHDRIYTEAAHGILEQHMNAFLPDAGQEYLRLPDGADLP
ncbi:MBL fold metallo-hydrolase [Nocardioides donggukensis]|uniref:MBL fold metallo-hydrolase n=1 Tax=Nocardioides donggukensis TaxID=2774019 RepID=A0A927PZU7_9ACTN|nr:MBL fold metallo-hydrolase [Nocardioides donggukensis]MBD8870808.1 MBL fold metallo-hydrolase [Nocardioides donggukensis]